MTTKGYTLLGWLTWRIGIRLARRKLHANRGRLLALAVIAAVVGTGFALAAGDRDQR